MSRYASNTSVSPAKTRMELEQLLTRFGADAFLYAIEEGRAVIQFRYHKRMVRFVLPLPSEHDDEFARTPARRKVRGPDDRRKAWEKSCRSRWRSLYLLVKALLVAIEDGLIDFDRAFMHDIVMPNGRTVGEQLLPELQMRIENGGTSPLLLPGASS